MYKCISIDIMHYLLAYVPCSSVKPPTFGLFNFHISSKHKHVQKHEKGTSNYLKLVNTHYWFIN